MISFLLFCFLLFCFLLFCFLLVFSLSVPPLVISFVEHMLAAKDKLVKGKRQDGGAFSDDGFALGRFRV